MRRAVSILLVLGLLVAPMASFAEETQPAESEEESEPGVAHRILTYVPCRIFDVLDVVRMRARVGPGVALDIRATQYVDLFLGSYGTLYVGLPGPRGRKVPKSPIWFETRTGVEVSVADATAELGAGPDYSTGEFGLGFQAAIIGFDFGVDPVEMLDLVGGILLFDFLDDDF